MAPQEVLLDKYYELDNIRAKLPQAAIDEIISVLQQTYGLGSVNYKEDRFETKLLNGKVLPQVHIVMKSSGMTLLQQDVIYTNTQQMPQIRLDHKTSAAGIYCKEGALQASDDYDPGSGAKLY